MSSMLSSYLIHGEILSEEVKVDANDAVVASAVSAFRC